MQREDGRLESPRTPGGSELIVERPEQLFQPATRRGFLRALGMGSGIVLLPSLFAACDDDPTGPRGDAVVLDLSDDFGILNYAYALEQLEAAFYVAVVGSAAFAGMSAEHPPADHSPPSRSHAGLIDRFSCYRIYHNIYL